MIRSGYVKFFMQNKSTYLVGRQRGQLEFVPTLQELEEILARLQSILINAFGSTNTIVRWLRGNIATSGNGSYASPFKTVQDAQNWAVANNRQVILLWHDQDATSSFNAGITLNADRIYLLGGKWNSNQKPIGNAKINIIFKNMMIGFLGNANMNARFNITDIGIAGLTFFGTNISNLDASYYDIIYCSLLFNAHHTSNDTFTYQFLSKNIKIYRSVLLWDFEPV